MYANHVIIDIFIADLQRSFSFNNSSSSSIFERFVQMCNKTVALKCQDFLAGIEKSLQLDCWWVDRRHNIELTPKSVTTREGVKAAIDRATVSVEWRGARALARE